MSTENSGMKINLYKLTVYKFKLVIKLFFKQHLTYLLEEFYDLVSYFL